MSCTPRPMLRSIGALNKYKSRIAGKGMAPSLPAKDGVRILHSRKLLDVASAASSLLNANLLKSQRDARRF